MNTKQSVNTDRPSRGPIDLLPFDFSKYLAATRERLSIFIIVSVVVAGCILWYMLNRDPLYKAQATIQLLRQGERQLQFEEVTQETLENSEDMNTQVQMYESTNILERVSDRIETDIPNQFLKDYTIRESETTRDAILRIVERNRNIIPSRLSLTVVIEFNHRDPKVAAIVANYFHEEISSAYSELRSETMYRVIRDIREQADIQQLKVQNLEREIHSFKNRHRTISFDRGLDLHNQEMGIINENLINSKEVLDQIYAKWSMVEQKIEAAEPLTELFFFSDQQNIQDLTTTISGTRVEIAQLSKRFRNLHPAMIQAKESLHAAEEELNTALDTQVAILRAQLKQAERNYHSSNAKFERKKQEILDLQELQSVYDSKMGDLEVNKTLYLQFFSRIQEIEAQNNGQTSRIRVVDTARIPKDLSQPDNKTSLALAILGGGITACAIVFLLILLDSTIKHPNELERRLSLPIIGTIGKTSTGKNTARELAKQTNLESKTSETLNLIIDSLRLNNYSRYAKSILIASTSPGEGKSYVAASLASAFKRYGEKTLLLNCNLRRIEDGFESMEGRGLIPYLSGDGGSIDQNILTNSSSDYDILPAGGTHCHPYRLFSSAAFKSTLDELRNRYDRIVIDSPSLHLYGDARNLLGHCDGQIFVTGFGVSKMDNAEKATQKLASENCPIFGVVINAIPKNKAKIYFPEFYETQKSLEKFERRKPSKGIIDTLKRLMPNSV